MSTGRDVKADGKIIATALERFKRCEEAESENRSKSREDLSFSLGEQWDDAVRRARQNDPNGARPCLTVDKLDQYVRQVVNDARQNKPSIKPRAKDQGADVETAEVLAGIVRHIEDQSSADIAYDTAAEMATRAGFGFLRVVTDYASDDGFEQDILIREVANPFSCYVDPDATQADGSDARYGFAWEDIPREQFKAQYPDADPCGFEAASEGVGEWIREGTVRVAEYFAVEDEPRKVWQGPGGQPSETEIPGAASRTVKRRKVTWRKITAREVLEEREWPSRYIGIVPVYGHRINVEGKRVIRSLIGPAKDAQRMYNYAASAFVERVALTPKAPYVATTAQIEGHEAIWQTANTGNYSVLPYNSDPSAPGAPQRQQAADIPSGWMAVMQSMEHDVQSALGMYNASIGAPSNEKSGKAILARQREADIATFHVVDNLSRAIRQVGRIVIDLIPRVYDTNRVVRILGEDGSEDFARIDPAQQEASREVHDEQGQIIERIYNPSVGRYDVTVTVGPAYSTKRQEAAEFLTQVVQSSPAMMQVAGDLMFKALDMPYADELSKRMAKMLPPPLQEQEGQQVPPEVQQQMQVMGQQMAQLQDQLSAAAAQLGDKRMEYEGKRADLMVKERELAIREYDAETKRIQAVSAGITPEALRALVINTMNEVAAKPAPLGSESQIPPMVVPEIEAVEPPEPSEMPEPGGMDGMSGMPGAMPMEMHADHMPSGGPSPREEPNG